MIFVRSDPALFPGDLLQRAADAQAELEGKPPEERVTFIKARADLWREFGQYLKKMSYGKCWYSEANDPHSFLDVDHFRPKARARRSEKETDEGYPWLAFSPENFRLAAQRSNRRSTNEDDDEVVGKGDWFPLAAGSPKATWDDRCTAQEKPMLLDPTARADVDLIDVASDARMQPSGVCFGANVDRVRESIRLYGLNLPRITEARQRVMRDVRETFETLGRILDAAAQTASLADDLDVAAQIERLRRRTMSDQPFARAARAALMELGGAQFCAGPEDVPARSL